ncbi:hypothetical protein HY932_02180 [Candidatus Falkowbacteria bacterium]|nr:hypothetical protein [Candidatus Falkowbacteria bacterium]
MKVIKYNWIYLVVLFVIIMMPICFCYANWMTGEGGAQAEFDTMTGGTGAGIQTTEKLPELIGKIISVILGLLGTVLLVLIIYAGWLWMSAGGEPKQVDKAKEYIKNAIMGLVLVLLAYAITDFVIDKLTLVQATGAQ